MAITKEIVVDKIEVLEMGQVQVRTATVIKEDGNELSRSFHRHTVVPSVKNPTKYFDANVNGTFNILECSRKYWEGIKKTKATISVIAPGTIKKNPPINNPTPCTNSGIAFCPDISFFCRLKINSKPCILIWNIPNTAVPNTKSNVPQKPNIEPSWMSIQISNIGRPIKKKDKI